jgi:hypothetical protein
MSKRSFSFQMFAIILAACTTSAIAGWQYGLSQTERRLRDSIVAADEYKASARIEYESAVAIRAEIEEEFKKLEKANADFQEVLKQAAQ